MTITTDASNKGWGAVCLETRTGGCRETTRAVHQLPGIEVHADNPIIADGQLDSGVVRKQEGKITAKRLPGQLNVEADYAFRHF